MGKPLFVIGKPKPGEPAKPGGITLGKPKKGEPISAPDVSEDVAELNRRMRLIEERNASLDIRLEVIEENAVKRHQKLAKEFKTFLLDISELRRDMNELKNKLLSLIKNMSLLARKEEVDVLKKYLDLWKPMNFVTRSEIQEIVQEEIKKFK